MKLELANGMTVILLENHAAPVVAFQAWVNVGSTDETPELAGMAHVHEHMLFKGTKKRGVGEIAKEVEGSGGDINAWTSFDQTVYHLVLASRFFETGLDILADAVRNSQFDAGELKRELEVVLEEIRRGKDSPSRTIGEEVFAMTYQKHPYGRPVIGYDAVVSTFTREQILDFYHTWYVPNNMVFIVVGDFNSKMAAAKIRKAFAGFKSGKVPRRKRPLEPIQKSIRLKVLRKNIQETYFEAAFHIPDLRHEDTPVLDLLSMVLSHGESSRLYHRIKEEKGLVNSISAFSFTPKDAGLFMLSGSLHHDKLGRAIEDSIEELAKLRYELVSAEELRRAKINILSEAIYDKETVEGQARKLGYYQTVLGDLAYEKAYHDRIEAVTPEDLKRVAEKYLQPDNMTLVALLPDKVLPEASHAFLKKHAMFGFQKAKKEGKSISLKGKEVETYSLKNGIKVLIKENHEVPLISIKAVSLGGLRYETPESNGLSSLMAHVWAKGTPGKTSLEIAKTIESMAGSIDAMSGRNSVGLSMEVLSQFTDQGLKLFTEVLRNPVFDAKELENERRNALESIRNMEDNLPSFAFKNFLKQLYGGHPYGMDSLGTVETVSRFKREDLRSFYERLVRPGNLVISVVGNVNPQQILEILNRDLGDWKSSPFSATHPAPVKPVHQEQFREIYRDKAQAHLVFGFQGTTLFSEDRYAIEVLNTVLSGQGGRLFLQLRDRQSLAYAVSSTAQEGIEPGFFAVYIGTDPRKVNEALEGIKRELHRVTSEKISKDELERARKYIVGSFEIDLQRASAQASSFAFNELYGLGWDEYKKYTQRIMKITTDDVLRVAKKYIDLDHPTVFLIRPKGEKNLSQDNRPKGKSAESSTSATDAL